MEALLIAAGGVFLYFRPERSLIFLGDKQVWNEAQRMHTILTTVLLPSPKSIPAKITFLGDLPSLIEALEAMEADSESAD